MRCADCKYWVPNPHVSNPVEGECTGDHIGSLYSVPLNGCGVEGRRLDTGPDFGCVHFQTKVVNITQTYVVYVSIGGGARQVAAFTDKAKTIDFLNSKAKAMRVSGPVSWVSSDTLDGFKYSYSGKVCHMYAMIQSK